MEVKSKKINVKKFFFNIILPSIISIFLFIFLIFWYIIPYFESSLLNSKKEMIRELVSTASNIAEKNYRDYKAGKFLTEQEAKADAINKISALRYGLENKDYFFIIDETPKMIMHPYRPDLNGVNLSNHKDPNGKRLFVEMVKVIKSKEFGYVDYKWQWMDDSSRIVPKISFVKEIKNWGWIIGTGIYIEDIKEKIAYIEKELIYVSIIITIIVAILITIIVFQNLKSEIKRNAAENELRISNEKYKKLVEASNEGTAMILDNELIFTNKIFVDLLNIKSNITKVSSNLSEIFIPIKKEDSTIFEKFISSDNNYTQIEMSVQTKEDSFITLLIFLSKIIMNQKTGLIITIKELSDSQIKTGLTKWERSSLELILSQKIGIIKLSMEENPKIIDLDNNALEILGYNSSEKIINKSFFDIAQNKLTIKNFIKELNTNKTIFGFSIPARKSTGEYLVLSIDAKVMEDPIDNQKIIIGFIKNITQQIENEEIKQITIAEMVASTRGLSNEIRLLKKETISCNLNLPIKKAVVIMGRNITDALLIRTDDGTPVGLVTYSDVFSRYYNSHLSEETPVREIMTSPLVTISENAFLYEAINKMDEKKVRHLLIYNNENIIDGIVSANEIFQFQFDSSKQLRDRIRNAHSLNDLKAVFKSLPINVASFINGGAKSNIVLNSIAEVSAEITRKLNELIIFELGETPVRFAFVSLGSEGRQEQTLLTDQDNAIIFDDLSASEENSAKVYFERYAERMNYMLDAVGFSYCKGNIMAKNPLWNQSLKQWKKYFHNWITLPEPKNIIDVSIFFDMRLSIGNQDLVTELLDYVQETINLNPNFLTIMAKTGLSYKSHLSFFGKLQTESTTEFSNSLNIKEAIRLIVNLVRLYSMKYNIKETNTLKRIKSIYKINGLSEDLYRDLLFSYEFLISLQIKNHIKYINRNSKPTNYVNIDELSTIETNILKSIFSRISVMQSKIKYDFGITE